MQDGAAIHGDDTEIWYVAESTNHALRAMAGAGDFIVASRIHENLREEAEKKWFSPCA